MSCTWICQRFAFLAVLSFAIVIRSSFAEIRVMWMTGAMLPFQFDQTCIVAFALRRWDRYCAVRRVGKATYVKVPVPVWWFLHWWISRFAEDTQKDTFGLCRQGINHIVAWLPWMMACRTNIQARFYRLLKGFWLAVDGRPRFTLVSLRSEECQKNTERRRLIHGSRKIQFNDSFLFPSGYLTLNFRHRVVIWSNRNKREVVMCFRCFIPYVNWLPEGANSVIFPKIYCFTMWRTHMRVKWISRAHHFSLASLHTDIAIAICWQTFDSLQISETSLEPCFPSWNGERLLFGS